MLADAGIRVNVALVPVLPRITDSQENVAEVVRAAREAGASKVWHNTLHLHEVTREAFFGYLRSHRPELLASYATLYRGKYAPREIANSVDAKVNASLADAPIRAVNTILPEAPLQISLL
jgi:DNA repair photolyase